MLVLEHRLVEAVVISVHDEITSPAANADATACALAHAAAIRLNREGDKQMTYTVKVEIKSWIDGRVLYAADVRTDVPDNLRTRAAVEEAVRNGVSLAGAILDGARLDGAILAGASLGGARLDGARLDGARLNGAILDGASLAGARLDRARIDGARLIRARLDGARIGLHTIKSLIARATRRDGYEFLAWRTEAGTVLITAGCQCVEGTDAYRKHVKTYGDRENGAALAAETLAILDYIDARAAQEST